MAVGVSSSCVVGMCSGIGHPRGVMAGEALRLAARPWRRLFAEGGGVGAASAEDAAGRELACGWHVAGDRGESTGRSVEVGRREQAFGVAVAWTREHVGDRA